LKPDVCRRVVGRLPTPSLERMCWRPRDPLAKIRGLSCEIARIFTRTVLSRLARSTYCQRPNRIPPERRVFSPEQRHTSAALPVLESLKLLSALDTCQPIAITGFPPVLHNLGELCSWSDGRPRPSNR
jgi:hypothetical protein